MVNTQEIERLLALLNEKEGMIKERDLELAEQREEFMSQQEELTAAIEELMKKNAYLVKTLGELKVRNEELDQILYRASHDLKTPVTSILGLISILESSASPDQQPMLNHLRRKGTQLNLILRSLSNLSIAFFREPHTDKCLIPALVQEAWQDVNAGEDFNFTCDVQEMYFSSDKLLVGIVLRCLLENAVNFCNQDGERRIRVTGAMSSSSLRLEVYDNGEDIPAEISENIFRMFYRGSVRSSGPGLGLYVARTIAERLHGNLILVNETPKKFVLTLPGTAASA